MPTISVKCKNSLIQDFDEQVKLSNYQNRSEAIRSLMKRFIDEHRIKRRIIA